MIKKIFFFLLFALSFACANSINLDKELIKKQSFKIAYFYDSSKHLTINDIKNIKFKKKISNNFSLSFKRGNSWLKLKIKNKLENEKYTIVFDEFFYNEVYLYEYKNNKIKKLSHGININKENKATNTKNPTFNLYLKKNEEKVLFIKFSAKYAHFGKIRILKSLDYLKSTNILSFMYLFILSAVFIIMLITIYLLLKFKQKIYLYYLFYSLFLEIYIFKVSNFIYILDLEMYIFKLHSSTALLIAFFILFSKELLEIKKYSKILSLLFNIFSTLFFILALIIFFEYNPWNIVLNNLATLSFLLLIISSIYTLFKGNEESKYYILATSLHFIAVLLFTSMVSGLIEYNFFTRYGFILTFFIEIMAFTLLLINKLYKQLNEKLILKDELIKVKNKYEIKLEEKIEKRTKSIKKINIKQEKLLKEREYLLKELSHRVKNNFQMLISILWIESQKVNTKDKHIFLTLTNRIKSMSLLHQLLYNKDEVNLVNIKEYLEQIATSINEIYQNSSNITFHIQNTYLSFEEALNLGVITNEIVTNSFKHNQEKKDLKIDITLKKVNKRVIFYIKDNGKGIKKEYKKSWGLNLVIQFSKKLNKSKYLFKNEKGVTFKIVFCVQEQ